VAAVQGLSGATILPDGRVVLILDIPALVTNRARRVAVAEVAHDEVVAAPMADERQLVMVVDDSITIRRVTERLLNRAGYRVITAKDGLDAMTQLQTESPAVMLLDIEMPRADGFEVATFVRNNERIKGLPIIMITSRSGEKHRERARQIGVDKYVIKPYQEDQLLAEVRELLAERRF
jgi:chemosensory pili system protein ChpA (sensor histidine kinase/response regulator)